MRLRHLPLLVVTSGAAISTLTDTFSDGSIAAVWDDYDPGAAAIAETDGKLVTTLGTSAGSNYAGVLTVAGYNLTAGIAYAEVPTVPANSTGTEAYLKLYIDSNNFVEWRYEGGTGLVARKKVAGTATVGATLTYSSTTHRWWRIQESGGSILFDTSADGVTWTNRYTTTVAFSVTNLFVDIGAGTYQSVGSPGTFALESFGVKEHPLSGSSAGVATAAATRIRLAQPLAGDSHGVATAAALRIRLAQPLAGDSHGVGAAAVPGFLAVTHPLTGSSAGVGAASATNLRMGNRVLAGDSHGVGSAAATNIRYGAIPLTGASHGVATVSNANLTVSTAAVAFRVGVSSVAGDDAVGGRGSTGVDHPLAGSSAGVGDAAATQVILSHPLEGTSAGVGSAAATGVRLGHALTGASHGVATAAVIKLRTGHRLEGTSAGVGAAAAVKLTITPSLEGASHGVAAVTSTKITVGHPLVGNSQGFGSAAATGFDIVSHALNGASHGVAALTGDVAPFGPANHALTGSSAGVGDAAATGIGEDHALTGASHGEGFACATVRTVVVQGRADFAPVITAEADWEPVFTAEASWGEAA